MLLLAMGLAAPALSAKQGASRTWPGGHSGPVKLEKASAAPARQVAGRKESAAAKLYRRQGYLVPNQAAYERAKAGAAAQASNASSTGSSRAPRSSGKGPAPLIASGDPDIHPAWTGISDPNVTPPDSTGAIGPTRYIELVNDRFGIYDRSGNVISTGGLQGFVDANTDCVTDPQIIWDPGTNRFYYVVLEFSHFVGPGCVGGENDENRLYIGFSRTASPTNGTSSWCKYVLPYFPPPEGSDVLPDYPKLGDTSNFLLIGSNIFDNATGSYLGADIAWITKPGPGTSCPGLLANHLDGPLLDHNDNPVFTPVPANQTDTNSTGYVVAAADPFIYGGASNFVDTFSISSDFDNPVGAPVDHTVTPFNIPANAPQSGTSALLDTLDGRLTQAVSAFDPSEGTTAVWTQHTVAGGAGSLVRWYEIEPTVPGLPGVLRDGSIGDPFLYTFNAAISPDRKVSGSTKRFGDAFVVGFNTSSSSDFVRIQMVSRWADNLMSGWVEVKASPGFNEDFSCLGLCRWGDYSGATPDPAANAHSNHGRVWLSNQWNVASSDTEDVDWRTYNWGTNPVPFVTLNGPTVHFQKSKAFNVSWTLGNQASAADVQYRAAPWNGPFGTPVLWQDQAPAGNATFTGNYARTYCFSAQSYDETDTGPRSWGFTSERCAVIPMDDRNLTASSGWSRLSGSGFFRGTYTRSTQQGKSLTKAGIHGKKMYVMVEKCPTCGSIKTYWNGSLKHSYSLRASKTIKRVFLLAASFSTVQDGTLKIVVSSSGKPVIIDALSVSLV